MSIEYAMLGLLGIKPMSGYEMKKIMQDSPFMHWSGNNNQIYKALSILVQDGFADPETVSQEGSPAKKVYTITAKGQEQLRVWTIADEAAPLEVRKPFLLKLAFSGQLSLDAVRELLDRYEAQVQVDQAMHRQKMSQKYFQPSGTKKEELLWEAIYENVDAVYEAELAWAGKLKERLADPELAEIETEVETERAVCLPPPESAQGRPPTTRKEGESMRYEVMRKDAISYIYYNSPETPLQSEQDFGEIISACAENSTNLAVFRHDALTEDFYNLRTGLAGSIIQKLTMYNIKTAVVMPDTTEAAVRYREMIKESNKGNAFRTYPSLEEAEAWLKET